jgi:hypothetical protein
MNLFTDKYPVTRHNYVGIEIECFYPIQYYSDIRKSIIKAGLEYNVSITEDSSITPPYIASINYIGREFKLIGIQSEIKSIVKSFCDILSKYKADTNETCGLHIHLDMRNRDVLKCFDRLIKVQPVLFQMMPSSRRYNNYCRPTRSNGGRDHYDAINRGAMSQHKTIEVRMHNGTTSAKEIINFIDILTHVIDNKPLSEVSKNYIQKRTQTYKQE